MHNWNLRLAQFKSQVRRVLVVWISGNSLIKGSFAETISKVFLFADTHVIVLPVV